MMNLTDIEKANYSEHIEEAGNESGMITIGLTTEHEAYLKERHGTFELDPIPSSDPKDPLNWPDWKKNVVIGLISFQICSCTFVAAGLTQAYSTFVKEYGITMSSAAYTTSCQIVIMGVCPIFFVPMMNTYGRNKFLILASFCNFILNIGGAYCKTYGQQMATRALVGLFNCTAVATGSGIVHDLTFSKNRGTKNGIWSTCLVLGTPMGPFITGFIIQYANVKWIFFMYAIMNFFQTVAWCIVDETVYFPEGPSIKWTIPRNKFNYALWIKPFKQFKNFNATIAGIAVGIAFCYANIAFIVELPSIMEPLFGLSPQLMSLQYISLIIGSFIGEILAGSLSDWWMVQCISKRGGKKVITDRLWVLYNGIILTIIGLLVWGICLAKAQKGHWIITPIIGCAIGAAGQNIVSTVATAFAIDSDPINASDIGLFINFWRQVYGFLGPFYFPSMFENLGYAKSAGILSGLVGFGGILLIFAHIRGNLRS